MYVLLLQLQELFYKSNVLLKNRNNAIVTKQWPETETKITEVANLRQEVDILAKLGIVKNPTHIQINGDNLELLQLITSAETQMEKPQFGATQQAAANDSICVILFRVIKMLVCGWVNAKCMTSTPHNQILSETTCQQFNCKLRVQKLVFLAVQTRIVKL